MVSTASISASDIRQVLSQVQDPEIPVLSVTDLGIIRDIKITGKEVEVFITPTYTGCPATEMISMNIKLALIEKGYTHLKITNVLSPPWTTDWITEAGKRKLKEYGIAAPDKNFDIPENGVECPHCNSVNTRLISEFGSTACKALYQCNDCREPFDYFKCH